MRELYLFKNFTPNQNGAIHYVVERPDLFYNRFQDKIALRLEDDNFRINGNILKIKYDVTQSETYYKTMTYVYLKAYDTPNEEQTGREYKNYFIKSVIIQSGLVIFTLELDLWGTYINMCSLSLATITRCNKRIGTGVYLPIETTNFNLNDEYPVREEDADYGKINDANVSIVFLLQYNALQQQSGIGDDTITKTELFEMNLQELKQALVSAYPNNTEIDEYSSVDIAVDLVGLIYGVTGGLFGTSTLDARVLKAYLIDNRLLKTTIYGTTSYSIRVKTRSSLIDPLNDLVFTARKIAPTIKYKHVTIENYDINKAYTIGTYNNGLELLRFTTQTLVATYICFTTTDDLKVIVQQGSNQKDITSAFEIQLTTNGERTTSLRNIAMSIKQLLGLIDKATSSYKEQQGLGVLKVGVNALVDSVNLKPNLQNSVGNGDGTNTFYAEQYRVLDKNEILNPYVVTYTTSIYDERKKALREGAIFNEIIDDTPNVYGLLYRILQAEYLQSVSEEEKQYYPTFVALTCNVENIPTDARDFIKNVLETGVYLSQ